MSNIKLDKIACIEEIVERFKIFFKEGIIPYDYVMIKIFLTRSGKYMGITDLQVLDKIGYYCAAVGDGNSIEGALEETIKYFLELLEIKEKWTEDDFEFSETYDF